jgi:endonuclease-3
MKEDSKARKQQRANEIFTILRKTYPKVRSALNFSSPLELLVATILSAQTTDKGVNEVTKSLFKKYKTLDDYVAANPTEFEQQIRPTGFYRNKTRSVLAACKKIKSDFGGEVPDNMNDLLSLPGVARKTANCVLGNAFGKNEGICVDRHVLRVAGRLGLTASDKPNVVEQDLMALSPQDEWTQVSHRLIIHGRTICTARKPDCGACPLNKLCPSAFKV